jgi:hypothetical protein
MKRILAILSLLMLTACANLDVSWAFAASYNMQTTIQSGVMHTINEK